MNTLTNNKNAILNEKKEIKIEFSYCSEKSALEVLNLLNNKDEIIELLERAVLMCNELGSHGKEMQPEYQQLLKNLGV